MAVGTHRARARGAGAARLEPLPLRAQTAIALPGRCSHPPALAFLLTFTHRQRAAWELYQRELLRLGRLDFR